jgi:signal transduction histidine kinase
MDLPSTERVSVARELHDGIAQDLVGIGYSLDLLLADSSLSNATRSQLRNTRLEIDTLLAKVRSEILRLRQPDSSPLATRLERVITESGLREIISFSSENVYLTDGQASECVAIATEILRNIESHAGATHVVINLYPVNNRTCLEISDNGIGGARMQTGHFGLQGIVERVENLGGSITIESLEGTRIAILI